MNESRIRRELLKRFSEILPIPGLRLKNRVAEPRGGNPAVDLRLDLVYRGKPVVLLCDIKAQIRSISIQDALDRLKPSRKGLNRAFPCLVAPYISDDFRKRLKEGEVFFMDLSGNVYLNLPGLYVEREGRANQFKGGRRSPGPFADKSSLVARYLFEHPRKYAGVREVAKLCGVSPGAVSLVFGELERLGYIVRDDKARAKLVRYRELLEDWVSFYRMKRQQELSFYWHRRDLEEMFSFLRSHKAPRGMRLVLSVHAGARLVAPFSNFQGMHAYVEGARGPEAAVHYWQKALGLSPVERGANVFLRIPSYRHSALFGARKIRGLEVVSDVQLYLDLRAFPARGEEQAEHVLQKAILPRFE